MTLKLLIDSRYLPDWYSKNYPAHIPLPDKEIINLKGEIIAWGVCDNKKIPLLSIDSGKINTQFDWNMWRDYILREEYKITNRPLYTILPFHYHLVPSKIRNIAAKFLLSNLGSTSIPKIDFPGFPIEQGFELLNYVYKSLRPNTEINNQENTRLILTHDIDTKDGFLWVKKIAKLEMEYGFRSIFNVVGQKYQIDYDILDWLIENGFEIGLHGYNHDNKLIFLPESEIRRRIESCRGIMELYDIKNFRSPSWFRNIKLFNVIKDYFLFDYSYLDTDILCPSGNGGCFWTKTFSLSDLIHIPTTIPFEAPLYFNYSPDKLVNFWEPKIRWLQKCKGNIVVITHTDPNFSGNKRMLKVYEKLLILLSKIKNYI